MINQQIALKYAEKECDICEGTGVVDIDMETVDYCICVKEGKAEAKADN